MMNRKLYLGLLILTLGIASCNGAPGNNGSSSAGGVPRAWFDAPLPGTIFWPPNPCQIVSHGASPSGISMFEFTVNGVAESVPSPDAQSSLVTLNRECGVSAPGRYSLMVRAQDNNGNWSEYADTYFIIGGDTPATEALPTNPPLATINPNTVTFPTISPTVLAASITLEEFPYDVIYIGASSCGPQEITFTAHAVAPNGITVVVLFYRFETGNSSSGFESVAMSAVGGDTYQRTLNTTSLFGGAIPFDFATLQYQVVVQQPGGDTSLRTPVMADIAVQACGSVTSACSTYPDKRACEAHGCRWVGSGTSYSCQP